jgi:hypothetical protein
VVDETDDAAGEARSVVGLEGGGVEKDEAPAGGGELPGVGWVSVGVEYRGLEGRGGLEGLPGGVVGEGVFEGGVLLEEEGALGGIDAVEVFGGGLGGVRETGAAEHDKDGDGVRGVFRRDHGHVELDGDGGVGGVVDGADEVAGDDAGEAEEFVVGGGDGPGDVWDVFGEAAVDVVFEEMDELGAALIPP